MNSQNEKIMQDLNEISLEEAKNEIRKRTENIRNISVIAHVDHGKTSLVDNLLCHNNIINPRLAGLIRFMDSLPEEQERCITMKTSSISIIYKSEQNNDNYLINIIDSPGHIDFTSEIFTAINVCEGGLLVIDVVEGVCSQTVSVLKQAWSQNLRLILVFNKIDRLINEIKLTPDEIYEHLSMLLEQINSKMSSLLSGDVNQMKEEQNEDTENYVNEKEKEMYFSPDKGNVVFASAVDSWGFSLRNFANFYKDILKLEANYLIENLWGQRYYNKKTKDFEDSPPFEDSKPSFVQFILDPIFKLYTIINDEKDATKVKQIADKFKINIPQSDLSYLSKDPKYLLRSFMRQWLPIAYTIFDLTVNYLPSPLTRFGNQIERYFLGFNDKDKKDNEKESCKESVNSLSNNNNSNNMCNSLLSSSELFKEIFGIEKEAVKKITEKELISSKVLGHILKMVTIPTKNCPSYYKTIYNSSNLSSNINDFITVPFARCFSGIIQKGKEYYLIGPKNKNQFQTIEKVVFTNLYTFMGDHLEEINEVYPGIIFSSIGIDTKIFKTAILTESPNFPIANFNYNFCPLIKVSISTDQMKDMQSMIQGLKAINRADPAVDYYMQSNGEHILETLGEVHMERVLKELEERYCKCQLKVSQPIIEFREGLVNTIYKKQEKKKNKKTFEKVNKNEKKKDYTVKYDLESSAEEDNYEFDEDEAKNGSVPTADRTSFNVRRRLFKPKNIVTDYKLRKEKADHYLEKCLHIKNNKKEQQSSTTSIHTSNGYCSFNIKTIGFAPEIINFLENHEKLLAEIDENRKKYPKDIEIQSRKFKQDFFKLIGEIEGGVNKKLLPILEDFTFSFCGKNYKNILIVKNLPKRLSYFKRKIFSNSYFDDECEVETNLKEYLKDDISVSEFYNSIKNGWSLAMGKFFYLGNGPLCDEKMYGVITIIDHISFDKEFYKKLDNSSEFYEKEKELREKESNTEKEKKGMIEESDNIKEIVEEKKVDENELFNKFYYQFGPFLGQVIGSIKEGIKISYLNGQPRLFEATYLCTFQIEVTHIGKIYTVISKRRGDVNFYFRL